MNSTLLAFSLGPWEIGLLFLVMVFAFGPKRIPEIGKSVGEAFSSFKKATNEVETTEEVPKLEE